MTELAQIGVTGLAVMGRNLARNFARHGYTVAIHNRTLREDRVAGRRARRRGRRSSRRESMADFVASPGAAAQGRSSWSRPAARTDAVIDELVPLLEQGDIIVDAGNAHFPDTIRREEALREQGLHFVGTGVSGGEEGALNGPVDHAGRLRASRTSRSGPMLESISAKVDGTPCCTHVGPDGAGHFVKMVHNGIEYADMQLIAEAYDLLRQGTGVPRPRRSRRSSRAWNAGDLESFLIEITAEVLRPRRRRDRARRSSTSILDQAEQKGTGRWTVQNALDLGVPITGHRRGDVRPRAVRLGAAARGRAGRRCPAHAAEWAVDDRDALHRGRPAGAVRVEGRRLLAGLRPDRRGERGVRLGHRPGRDGADLARRLHHPGPVPEPDHRGVRARRRTCRCCSPTRTSPTPSPTALPAWRRVVAGAAQNGDPDAGVLVVAGLLRRHPRRAAARRADPGAARLLRRPHLPARRQAGHLPHRVERSTAPRPITGGGAAQVLPPEPAEKATPPLPDQSSRSQRPR